MTDDDLMPPPAPDVQEAPKKKKGLFGGIFKKKPKPERVDKSDTSEELPQPGSPPEDEKEMVDTLDKELQDLKGSLEDEPVKKAPDEELNLDDLEKLSNEEQMSPPEEEPEVPPIDEEVSQLAKESDIPTENKEIDTSDIDSLPEFEETPLDEQAPEAPEVEEPEEEPEEVPVVPKKISKPKKKAKGKKKSKKKKVVAPVVESFNDFAELEKHQKSVAQPKKKKKATKKKAAKKPKKAKKAAVKKITPSVPKASAKKMKEFLAHERRLERIEKDITKKKDQLNKEEKKQLQLMKKKEQEFKKKVEKALSDLKKEKAAAEKANVNAISLRNKYQRELKALSHERKDIDTEKHRLKEESSYLYKHAKELKEKDKTLKTLEKKLHTKEKSINKRESVIKKELAEKEKLEKSLKIIEAKIDEQKQLMEQEGFKKYVQEELGEIATPQHINQMTNMDGSLDVHKTKHFDLYNLINESRQLLRINKLGEAQQLYNKVKQQFYETDWDNDEERDELFNMLKDLYDDIKLAVMNA